MKTYRLNAAAARRLERTAEFKSAIHPSRHDGTAIVSDRTYARAARYLGSGAATAQAVGEAELRDADKRLVQAWASYVHEPPTTEVIDEARLRLVADRGLQLEYMGRGRFFNELHLPSSQAQNLEWIDVAGGKRSYLFRRIEAPLGEPDARMKANDARYQAYKGWVDDEGARVVVSLGGGGWRLFAATGLLKLLDHLLGDRRKVSEVWGCSGGAVLGWAYSLGFDPQTIDELGFDIYQSRNPLLGNGSPGDALRTHWRVAMDRLHGRPPTTAVGPWLAELDKKQPEDKRLPIRLPFYAIATNTRSSQPVGLAAPDHIPAHCRDLILPCDPRDAVAASTAVPFMLTPLRGITGAANDTWVDGSVVEENPLSLPFAKWMRDRKEDPKGTPDRLKILSVHLNLRLSESALLKTALAMPVVKRARFLKHAARLLDLSLDSKTYAPVQILKSVPNVEVFCSKLTLGWMHFNSHREIPSAMRHGRTADAWQNTLHRAG